MDEKRMADDYEIVAAMSIGCKEIVMGENPNVEDNTRYMCAYCEGNSLFERYNEVLVSGNYVDILQVYCQRLSDEAGKLKKEIDLELKLSTSTVPPADYTAITAGTDLRGKVIVIKPQVLKREYRRSIHQYQYVTGGSGASPNGRGTSVFTVALYGGEKGRYARHEVLGVADPNSLPTWAKAGLDAARADMKKDKEAR